MNKTTIESIKSITLKEIMKMSDAEMNAVCDALFNDDDNDDWFERAGRETTLFLQTPALYRKSAMRVR